MILTQLVALVALFNVVQAKSHISFHARPTNNRVRRQTGPAPDVKSLDWFDARHKWPKCVSIGQIWKQGQCKDSHAIAAASVISDRICIQNPELALHGVNISISAHQAASCHSTQTDYGDICIHGGDPVNVYKHAASVGLVTGGDYNSEEGCVPYSVAPDQRPPLCCATDCTNKKYETSFQEDNIRSKWSKYHDRAVAMTQEQIEEIVLRMKHDIMTEGPLTVVLEHYDDLANWGYLGNEQLPYTDHLPNWGYMAPYCRPRVDSKLLGNHTAKVIGWFEKTVWPRHWLLVNPWGRGVLRVEMGRNCVGIEQSVSAPFL